MEGSIQTKAGQEKTGRKVVSSESLFEGRKEIIILHKEHQYRLQLTKTGKLILNK